MTNVFEEAQEKAKLSEKARKIIESRTGHPKGLLEKTEERIRTKYRL